jgi:hypothetical protein
MAEEDRRVEKPANERGDERAKEKKAPALFGWLGRKVA